MSDDEELFTHTVRPWTAGELRKALDGVPDEFPVRVWYAEEPGGEFVDEQVVISAAPWSDQGEDAPPDYFSISLEFPPGQYYRRKR